MIELNALEMIYIIVSWMGTVEIQFTQHGFELSSFTFMWIFLNKCILLCETVYSCLNSWIQSQGYRGLTIKFYMDFLLCTPKLCYSKIHCTVI